MAGGLMHRLAAVLGTRTVVGVGELTTEHGTIGCSILGEVYLRPEGQTKRITLGTTKSTSQELAHAYWLYVGTR